MSRTRVRVGALSDVGRMREHNEDFYGYLNPDASEPMARRKGSLFVVCDGMGGHQAGEVASKLAVDVILDAYFNDPTGDPGTALVKAVKLANQRIYQQSSERSELRGMGTTCVASVVVGDRSLIAHAGDSRAYLLRDGELVQVTQDHSWVNQQVALGLLSEDEARDHPMVNIITRALGHTPEVEVELTPCLIEEGDLFLLCSDGLSTRVTDAQIRDILLSMPDLDEASRALIAAANEAGGPDNISVVIIYVERIEQTGASMPVIMQTVETSSFTTDTNPVPSPSAKTTTSTEPLVLAPETIKHTPGVGRRVAPGCFAFLGVIVALAIAAAIGAGVAWVLGWRPGVVPTVGIGGAPTTPPAAAITAPPTEAPVPTVTTAPPSRPSEGPASLVGRQVSIPANTDLYAEPGASSPLLHTITTQTGRVVQETQANPPANADISRAPGGRANTWLRIQLDSTAGLPVNANTWVWIGSAIIP